MVCLEDFKNAGIAVAIAVACLGEVSVFKVLHVSDVRKGDSVAMLANDVGHIVFGVGAKDRDRHLARGKAEGYGLSKKVRMRSEVVLGKSMPSRVLFAG